jgi:RNA polymerase sigma-70 factor, ECF subfamily
MVADHVDFVWRTLERFGVAARDLDDAVQEVFVVASRRLEDCETHPRGFLFRTAVNVAAHFRRSFARRRETGQEPSEQEIDPALPPDERLDQERARALLWQVLEHLTIELRTVFVLFELEELSTPQIAELLELPAGTVASRLRRAREQFVQRVRRLEAASRRPS